MSKIKEILTLHDQKISGRQISVRLHVSRNTVSAVLKAACRCSLGEAELEALTESELQQKLFPEKATKQQYHKPDFAHVHSELKRSGVTLELLWKEYQKECRGAEEKSYKYSRFCDLYREYVHSKGLTMVLNHKPGDEVMVDWAGTTMTLMDPEGGPSKKVYIFVSVLPFSMYVFAWACPDMSEASWIDAHNQMFQFYAGIPRLLICDNTKTAVVHNRKSEPVVLNKVYAEMAEYYDTAVLPTRVRRPQDKAAVEASVRLVTEQVIAPLRNTSFFSVAEINTAIRDHIEQLNHRPFQKRPGSRWSVFTSEEASLLGPLPPIAFQAPVWRTATVQKNYHVLVGKQYFSVPYQLVGSKVDIRTDDCTVRIFHDGEEVAAHIKEAGQRYHTVTEHMPAGHRAYQEWNAGKFLLWAKEKGEAVREVARRILSSYSVEEQAYKTLFALLNLPKRFPRASLNSVCSQILESGVRITLRDITARMEKSNAEAQQRSNASSQHALMRGSSFYSKASERSRNINER